MQLKKIHGILLLLAMTAVAACRQKADNNETGTADSTAQVVGKSNTTVVFKGTYSFAPGAKVLQLCGSKSQLWAVDSSAQLELKYSQIYSFEQSGTPVYAEVEGYKTKSENTGEAAAYDSTVVVKKVLKMTKDIPADCK